SRASREHERPEYYATRQQLVPKLRLGTHCQEAPLRFLSDNATFFPPCIEASEAELRGSAFPTRGWERGQNNMTIGSEWLVDATGCRPEGLRDLDGMRRVCDRIVSDLDLHVVGEPLWHQFPWPGGVTSLYLLTESHLACHTYPELGLATFNLYCCRSRPPWPWEQWLQSLLGASHVTIRCMVRVTN